MDHKNIWTKTLNPNEAVKYEFTISKKYTTASFISCVVIGLLMLVSGYTAFLGVWVILIGAFYYGFYLRAANAYAFTDRRVLVHRGWLSTKLVSTEYQKITDVTVHEPFLSRLAFKTGSLEINTAGTSSEEIVLKHIENPYEVKKQLDSLRGHR